MRHYAYILPTLIAEPGLPALGDDVIIGKDSRCDPVLRMRQGKRELHIASVPREAMSGDSMRLMVPHCAERLSKIASEYTYRSVSPSEAGRLRLEVKSLLENYRSILDYVAQDILATCPGRCTNRRTYFPIAGPKEDKERFKDRLGGAFPGLADTHPRAAEYLLQLQGFDDTSWLRQLGETVNKMKHKHLLNWRDVICTSTVIHNQGVGVRFGELGCRSMKIDGGRALVLVAPDGTEQRIRGPQDIDVSTTQLRASDPQITIDRHNWKASGLAGTSQSLVGFLAETDRGVRLACTNLTALLRVEGDSE